jgi:hypothetical protein
MAEWIAGRVAVLSVHGRIHTALCSDEQAERRAGEAEFQGFHLVLLNESIGPLTVDMISNKCCNKDVNLGSLVEIFKFNNKVKSILRRCPNLKLAFCAGTEPSTQLKIAFLLGCHLIMEQGLGFEATYMAFRPLHSLFETQDMMGAPTIRSSFRAFCCCKCLNWIDFSEEQDSSKLKPLETISMDEHMHYAR